MTLSRPRGKNVPLAFFPLAFPRVRTTEMSACSEDEGAFRFHSARAYVRIDQRTIVRWTFAEETTGTRRESAELLERIRPLT
ncbi:MAG TPA: hypothetical protein VHG35_01640 [Gemmatimonadales bacterium]|nr:hypothetical protein [Gemmatimonadales bacterium]